ncbi:hypothetical protein ERC79_20980 [Rhodococcus sp. ABRD24]|uniref:hypothetical protein n=1 Tax=Rhodococcus sp. ABRD24 TaxID=2507582 RepID=UPI001038CF0A|nr:hypothetical protein [Rhodococcus sp. ABRD24]QBJ98139.1 hypothetical protein ERC79_20980 [Rhodococcus sp. ABRD24]
MTVSELPRRTPRRIVSAAALRIGWLACIVAILVIPGMIALMSGMPATTAGLVTLFTTTCVAIAALLVNFR